ncbi:MAG: amidophosphoribosyltransferase, partial [Acidimicrobiia bacterium]
MTALPLDKLSEACGVVAVYSENGAVPLVHRALFELQHRGQEAAGIVSTGPTDAIHSERSRGLVADGGKRRGCRLGGR